MAHSYIFINEQNEERSVGVSDGTLLVLIYFFRKLLKENNQNSILSNAFIKHFNSQLSGNYPSMLDLLLNEVFSDKFELRWYLDKLDKLENYFNSFKEYVDNEYLNQLTELGGGYTKPIPVKRFIDLIGNIRWVLRVKNIQPKKEGFVIDQTDRA